jgi:hypothetical protein
VVLGVPDGGTHAPDVPFVLLVVDAVTLPAYRAELPSEPAAGRDGIAGPGCGGDPPPDVVDGRRIEPGEHALAHSRAVERDSHPDTRRHLVGLVGVDLLDIDGLGVAAHREMHGETGVGAELAQDRGHGGGVGAFAEEHAGHGEEPVAGGVAARLGGGGEPGTDQVLQDAMGGRLAHARRGGDLAQSVRASAPAQRLDDGQVLLQRVDRPPPCRRRLGRLTTIVSRS